MAGIVERARSGAWLNRERLTVYSIILIIAYLVTITYMIVTSPDGKNDFAGRPLGTDFSNVYAAGTYVLEGQASSAFDPKLQHMREQAIFGAGSPFFGWHYPPFFLGLAGLLALLPYAAALVVWQATTFGLYLVSVRGMLGAELRRHRVWICVAVAFPAVIVNLGHGHNGFLTTALLGGSLLLLGRRPVVAGVLLGLLAYKPQFGVLLPLALLAGGHWKALAAAAATVATMALGATLAWGEAVWHAFLQSTEFTRVVVLENGGTGWHKIQTMFSAVRMLGGGVDAAYIAQGVLLAVLAVAIVMLWRSKADWRLKSSALAIAALLGTPYSLDYDMMALAVPLALFASYGNERGFGRWSVTLLCIVWVTPLVARGVAWATYVPLGVIVMIAFFVFILRRAAADSEFGNGLRKRFKKVFDTSWGPNYKPRLR